MSSIVKMYDASNNDVYPITHLRAVRDSNGTTLESMIQGVNETTVGYYECNTAGSTPEKTITIDSSVSLSVRISCKVKFAEKNTGANATMNINNTGAKPLFYNGVRAAANNSWYTNEIVDLYFDGTNYQAKSCADTLEYDVSLHQTHEITEVTTTTRTVVYNGDVTSGWENETSVSDSSANGYTRTETNTGKDNDATTVDGPTAKYDTASNKTSVVYVTKRTLTHVVNDYTFDEAVNAVPMSYRHGGLKLRFISNSDGSVHNSDNKYVQYRLMANEWSTTVSDWQGVDDEPTTGSNNLVKSGGVAYSINQLKNSGYFYAGIATPTTNPGTPDGPVFYIANGKGTYTNFGGIDVTDDEVVILYYDTSWHKETTGIASNDKLTELEIDIHGTITKSITLAPNVYYTINGIDYSEIGSSVKIKASCPVGKVVWVYTIINGTRTNVATLRDGNAKEITIVTGLTAIEVRSQEFTDFDAVLEISKSTYILQEISQLVNSVDGIKSDIQGIDLRKYPFASDATFTQNGVVYDLNNYIKSIQLDNCKNNALYYVRIFYNSATYRMLVISEKDAQGNVSDIVTYRVSHTEKYIGAESIKFGNLTCYLIWGDFGYDNLRDTTAPLHRMVCKESSHPDSAIILPTNLYLATGVEFNAYSRMIISNVADNDIVDFSCGGSMRKHKRGFRYTATDTSPNINNEDMKVRIAGNVEISKKFNIKPVRSTSGAGKTLNVLCLGSSTTDQGYYIEHTRDLFSSDAMNVNFLGTIQTKGANPTNCEGRSGWRLRTFFSSDGTSDAKPQMPNPFFDNTKEEFSFDAFNFSMYMRNQGYSSCDVLIIAMASNDNVSTQQNEGYAKDYCDAIIASAKAYNPNIIIGIWLHNAGYYFYEGALNQIDLTLELNKKVISWYDNRETENIFVMPVNANVDPLYDYPCREDNVSLRNSNFKELTITDPVHVDKSTGAKKIGDICYSYLKYWGGIEL